MSQKSPGTKAADNQFSYVIGVSLRSQSTCATSDSTEVGIFRECRGWLVVMATNMATETLEKLLKALGHGQLVSPVMFLLQACGAK